VFSYVLNTLEILSKYIYYSDKGLTGKAEKAFFSGFVSVFPKAETE